MRIIVEVEDGIAAAAYIEGMPEDVMLHEVICLDRDRHADEEVVVFNLDVLTSTAAPKMVAAIAAEVEAIRTCYAAAS